MAVCQLRVDVFGTDVSVDYEKSGIYHLFYPDNDDSLIDATLDLEGGEIVYLRDTYDAEEHRDFLGAVEEELDMENSYDFAGQVNDYARY